MTTPSIELPVDAVLATSSGAERPLLEAMLEYYRAVVKRKALGVSESDLRRRLVPSQTTLGGLLKHLAAVERRWFEGTLVRHALVFPLDETARHAGHADIIRELIDGSTGDF